MSATHVTPKWTVGAPLATLGLVAALELAFHAPPLWLLAAAAPLLLLSVLAAVHHAEVVAHRIGQPIGSVVLALAVTAIEVSLIVSVLLSDVEGDSTVARDTVFAAIMIVMNGIVGLCLLIGGIRYHRQDFRAPSALAALGVLSTLAVLALILPNFTLAEPGPVYAPAQLFFVAVVSLFLYGLFLFVQTVSHSDDFLDAVGADLEAGSGHASAPASGGGLATSVAMLPVSLLAVVLLAELLADPVQEAIVHAGLPEALVGVVIALIVLLPEGLASVRAARQNRLQTSLNLALGSALASISLTIPTVALISLALERHLVLGLDAEHIALLVLTLFLSSLSLATGRTTFLQGGIHLVIFGAFLTVSAIP